MKTKRTIFPIVLLAIGIIAFNACKKEASPVYSSNNIITTTPTVPVGNYPAGLGDVPGTPVCSPYILPSNIEVVGEIQSSTFKSTNFNKETQNVNDFIITPKTTFIQLGSGSLVQVYMKFYNKSSQPTSLIIPGGLMFCPGDTTTQTGITIQPDTLIIPGNDTTGCNIKAYCTNLHKGIPNNTNYKILGTTLHSDLWEMVGILKTKKKLSQGSQVQSIIWNVTDRGGLTEQDRTYLNNLP